MSLADRRDAYLAHQLEDLAEVPEAGLLILRVAFAEAFATSATWGFQSFQVSEGAVGGDVASDGPVADVT